MNATTGVDSKRGKPRSRIGVARGRAERLNLTLRAICLRVGVCYSTVDRWERGSCDPGVSKFEAALQKIEGALEAEEKRLLGELGERGAA